MAGVVLIIALQARHGEVVASARAMTEDTMRQIYEFNNDPSKVPRDTPTGPASRKRKAEEPTLWGGYRVRTMLHCLYVTSMLCLLRYDEALSIRWDDVQFAKTPAGDMFLELHLLVRKTHQNGGKASHLPVASRLLIFIRNRTIRTLQEHRKAVDVSRHRVCQLVVDDAAYGTGASRLRLSKAV